MVHTKNQADDNLYILHISQTGRRISELIPRKDVIVEKYFTITQKYPAPSRRHVINKLSISGNVCCAMRTRVDGEDFSSKLVKSCSWVVSIRTCIVNAMTAMSPIRESNHWLNLGFENLGTKSTLPVSVTLTLTLTDTDTASASTVSKLRLKGGVIDTTVSISVGVWRPSLPVSVEIGRAKPLGFSM